MRLQTIIASVFLLACFTPNASGQDSTYSPAYMHTQGKELIAVYIGATDCGPCHTPALKSAIKRMKVILKRRAKARGRTFTATGVALDWHVDSGVEFLRAVGPFDEIIVGKRWINLGVVEYIWADTASFAALPQVVLVERTVQDESGRKTVSPSVIVARYVGPKTVAEWVNAGAPACWTKEEHGPLSWVKEDCALP